jgi:phage terminase large subunit-like protein
LVEGSERLAPKFTTAKWGAGQEELPAINGARYKLAAASRRGGRSLSVDLGIADELREHKDDEAWAALIGATVARPNAQIWALTTMSDDSAVVLNDLRARALAYIERGEGDDSICLLEWSGPEDCEVTDRDAWRMANPALASPVENTITEATLASNLATMSQERFRIEHLCQRVASMDTAVDLQAWEACSDPGTLDDARDRVALCLDVSPDLAHVTLAAAATLDDGRARVEVARAWESTDAARQELPALVDRIQPRTLGWFPNGPGASLAADLKRDGMEEIRDVPAVCMGLAEQVIAQRVVHSNDPLLSTQVSAASKLAQGDAWRFTRKGSGHVDAVYATAGALHLARTLPPIEEPELPPRIYVFDPDEDALIA